MILHKQDYYVFYYVVRFKPKARYYADNLNTYSKKWQTI